MKEKRVLLQLENVRVREDDSRNVAIESYQEVYNAFDQKWIHKWGFEGFAQDIFSALKLITRRHLLVDTQEDMTADHLLQKVEESERRILGAIDELKQETSSTP